jgi:hypothetical protein
MVNATPRPLKPRQNTRVSLHRRLGGPQGRSGRMQKTSPQRDFFYFLVFSLYFIRTCFCVLIVLHYAFRLLLYNTHNTKIHAARRDSNPQSQQAIGLRH